MKLIRWAALWTCPWIQPRYDRARTYLTDTVYVSKLGVLRNGDQRDTVLSFTPYRRCRTSKIVIDDLAFGTVSRLMLHALGSEL